MNRSLLLLLLGVTILLLVLANLKNPAPSPQENAPPSVSPVTAPSDSTPGCLTCHKQDQGAPEDPYHRFLPCEACHLGQPEASKKELAHVGLELEPGALDTVELTCAPCHRLETKHVASSLMTTGHGLIAVNRWAFGEIPQPDGQESFGDLLTLTEATPAQDHLQKLCAGCHLGTRRDNRDDAIQGIGSGCSACHLSLSSPTTGTHPVLTAQVSDESCLGCHSRSGRVSLSYQGLAEVSGPPAEHCENPVTLFDGRSGCQLEEDLHHRAGLLCVDCHVHSEIMGDGTSYAHKEDAVEIACSTCHEPYAGEDEDRWSQVQDPITDLMLALRSQVRGPEEAVRRGSRGTPLWNLRAKDDHWILERKHDGQALAIPPTPQDSKHGQPGHERLSCTACHSAWAPTCPTCHTSQDPEQNQWDFAEAKEVPGAWIETNDGMGWGPPSLGIDAHRRISPAIPGMIAHLDLEEAGGENQDLRLFAAMDPHTTGLRARSCEACHRDSIALGLGTGKIIFGAGGPSFLPQQVDKNNPSMAQDGWTPLFPQEPGNGTRRGARSLNRFEHQRLLTVGYCGVCHRDDDSRWQNFPDALQALRDGTAPRCDGTWALWMGNHPG